MVNAQGDIGYICDGQLAAMGVEAAEKRGLHPVVYGLNDTSSAAQAILQNNGTSVVSDSYTTPADLDAFVAALKVGAPVAFDWEGVPTQALIELRSKGLIMKPGFPVLETTQHRLKEKEALNSIHGKTITAPYEAVESFEDGQRAFQNFGKGRFKSTMGGYDGKSQWPIENEQQIVDLFDKFGNDIPELVYEQHVDFVKELSVAVGLNAQGEFGWYDPFLNHHEGGIIRTTHVGDIGVDQEIQEAMIAITKKTAEELGVEGIMTLETFLTAKGDIIANEVAGRLHNSGHITSSTHGINHAELQIMAMLNEKMPGHIPLKRSGQMVNVIGDDVQKYPRANWDQWSQHWPEDARSRIVSYGKGEAKDRRKMGHIEKWDN